MGPIEFLSSLGGLFGLCLGFSIMSLLELVYWAVLRSPSLQEPTGPQAAQEDHVEAQPELGQHGLVYVALVVTNKAPQKPCKIWTRA